MKSDRREKAEKGEWSQRKPALMGKRGREDEFERRYEWHGRERPSYGAPPRGREPRLERRDPRLVHRGRSRERLGDRDHGARGEGQREHSPESAQKALAERRSYAEVAKAAAHGGDRSRSKRYTPPEKESLKVREDEEGEWVLVRSKKSRKVESTSKSSQRSSPESTKSAIALQCHKCAQRGHTIHECTNQWFCYARKCYGHISTDYKRSKGESNAIAQPLATPKLPTRQESVQSETEESAAGGRRRIKAVISPTPIMAEFERRFSACLMVEAQTGNPIANDIEMLLAANSNGPTIWKVQQVKQSVFYAHSQNPHSTKEMIALRGLDGVRRDGISRQEFYVTFSPWSRNVGALETGSLPSLWIRLFNFPFHCWVRSVFQNLIRGFGYLIEIDRSTLLHTRRDIARIKVGLEAKEEIPPTITAEFEGVHYEVKVITEIKKSVSFVGATVEKSPSTSIEFKGERKKMTRSH